MKHLKQKFMVAIVTIVAAVITLGPTASAHYESSYTKAYQQAHYDCYYGAVYGCHYTGQFTRINSGFYGEHSQWHQFQFLVGDGWGNGHYEYRCYNYYHQVLQSAYWC